MEFKGKKSIEDLVKSAHDSMLGTETSVVNQKAKDEKPTGVNEPTTIAPQQPLKQASLEVLLQAIIVSADKGTTVYPVRCPGKGRVNDYGKDGEGKPACAFSGNSCPYFSDAMFNIADYFKQITCLVDKKAE